MNQNLQGALEKPGDNLTSKEGKETEIKTSFIRSDPQASGTSKRINTEEEKREEPDNEYRDPQLSNSSEPANNSGHFQKNREASAPQLQAPENMDLGSNEDEALPPEIPVHEIVNQMRLEFGEPQSDNYDENEEESSSYHMELKEGELPSQLEAWKAIQRIRLDQKGMAFESDELSRASCKCCNS